MYRNHLEKLVRTRLDDVLVDEGVLDRERMESAQAEQDQTGKLLSDVLIDSGTVDEWDLARLIVSHYALPFVDPKLYSIPAQASDILPLDWCRAHSVLPLDHFGASISLACVEVPTSEVIQEITERTGCSPFLYVTSRRSLREVIEEMTKRANRNSRSVPAKAPLPAVSPKAAKSPELPAKPSVPAAPVVVAADVSDDALPPLDLPHISMRLDATASSSRTSSRTGLEILAAAAVSSARARQERPAAAPQPPVIGPGGASAPRVAFPAAVAARAVPAPAAVPPAAPARAVPEPKADRPAAPRPDVGAPRTPGRAAPVLPAVPAAAAAKAGAQQTGWESIFDIGDSAVRGAPDSSSRRSRG